MHARFEPARKTRRWELEMLADRGYEKQRNGKRIGVIHDTTSFKGIKISRTEADAQKTDEQCFELRMQQILIQQLVRAQQCKNRNSGGCIERVMERIMKLADVPCPWHAEQSYLAEWQAVSTREILMNLDSGVDAGNLAQKQAAKHKSKLAAEAEEEWDNNDKAKIVIEVSVDRRLIWTRKRYRQTHKRTNTNFPWLEPVLNEYCLGKKSECALSSGGPRRCTKRCRK